MLCPGGDAREFGRVTVMAFIMFGEGWRTLVDRSGGSATTLLSLVLGVGYRPRRRRDVWGWRELEVYLDGLVYAYERLGPGWVAAVRAANQAGSLGPVVDERLGRKSWQRERVDAP